MDDDSVRPRLDGERMRDGTWARGNHAAKGNVNALKQFRLRREILESAAASPEAVRAAFSRLFRRAIGKAEDKDGSSIDIEAMRLYLAYAIGRPVQALELSGPDGEALGTDLAKVRAAILGAVEDQETRYRIARALLSIGSGDGDEPERPVGP